MMYRQGDILLKKCDSLPEVTEELKRDDRQRIVLAYGESTGHAHAIHSKNVTFIKDKSSNKFFLIVKKEYKPIIET